MTENAQETNLQKLLNDMNFVIESPISGSKKDIKGFESICKFYEKEYNIWNSLPSKLTNLQNQINHFKHCNDKLIGFKQNLSNRDEATIKSSWDNINNSILMSSNVNQRYIVFSITPEGNFLYDLYKENPEQGEASLNYFSNINTKLDNVNYFIGFLKTYEFVNQSDSHILKRRNQEKKCLADLRNIWEQKTQDLNIEFEEQKRTFNEWKDEFVNNHVLWQDNKILEFKKMIAQREENLNSLENLYRVKLGIEAPAEYWRKRAKKYRNHGYWWVSLLTITILALIVFLFYVLYNMPIAFINKTTIGDTQTLKGLIILVTIISFGAYLINVFSKLTFSSFHLQRDSEEREQLTLVYLALCESGKIEKEDRNLVLQSIFSRTDTGLIGKESSPSMPGVTGIIEKIAK